MTSTASVPDRRPRGRLRGWIGLAVATCGLACAILLVAIAASRLIVDWTVPDRKIHVSEHRHLFITRSNGLVDGVGFALVYSKPPYGAAFREQSDSVKKMLGDEVLYYRSIGSDYSVTPPKMIWIQHTFSVSFTILFTVAISVALFVSFLPLASRHTRRILGDLATAATRKFNGTRRRGFDAGRT